MYRFLPYTVFVLGMTVLLYAMAMWSGTSIPFQDAPPELLIQQNNELRFAKSLGLTGTGLASFGILWILWRWRKFIRTSPLIESGR